MSIHLAMIDHHWYISNILKSSQNEYWRGATIEPGRIPRISRLMALAIRFDGLLRQGLVRDYTDLARLGFVSKPRVTQIMNLLLLAPDIQEEILFLPTTSKGRDPITERHVRSITRVLDWDEQRMMWQALK